MGRLPPHQSLCVGGTPGDPDAGAGDCWTEEHVLTPPATCTALAKTTGAAQPIADNFPVSGVSRAVGGTFEIGAPGTVDAIAVYLDATHASPFDLVTTQVFCPDGRHGVLVADMGALLRRWRFTSVCKGAPRSGTWKVLVEDLTENGKTGTLDGVQLWVPRDLEVGACIDPTSCTSASIAPQLAIPDATSSGPSTVTSDVVTGLGQIPGAASEVLVDVAIAHTWRGDLELSLVCTDGRTALLRPPSGGSADDLRETFHTFGCAGAPNVGTWKLVVRDTAPQDVGTLERWSVRVIRDGEPIGP